MKTMTATNINIDQLINLLMNIANHGVSLVDLDMIPDENHPHMMKLILHPVKTDNMQNHQEVEKSLPQRIKIYDPNVDTDNNDIFNKLNDLV